MLYIYKRRSSMHRLRILPHLFLACAESKRDELAGERKREGERLV